MSEVKMFEAVGADFVRAGNRIFARSEIRWAGIWAYSFVVRVRDDSYEHNICPKPESEAEQLRLACELAEALR